MMPIMKSVVAVDVPPAEISGSCRPVTGSTPDHVADVDERLTEHPHRGGGGQQPQERVGRTARDPHPGVGEQPEQCQQPECADEAEFLADDREDEVVVGVGQVVPLGGALTETVAEDAAVGQRELRLPGLVAGVLRVLSRGPATTAPGRSGNPRTSPGSRRRQIAAQRAARKPAAAARRTTAGASRMMPSDTVWPRSGWATIRASATTAAGTSGISISRSEARSMRRAASRCAPQMANAILVSSEGCIEKPAITNHFRETVGYVADSRDQHQHQQHDGHRETGERHAPDEPHRHPQRQVAGERARRSSTAPAGRRSPTPTRRRRRNAPRTPTAP